VKYSRHRTDRLAKRKAFTVLEIVVMAALVLLILSLTKPVFYSPRPAQRRVRQELTRLYQALEQYRQDTGSYPATANGLQALMKQFPGSTNWQGPYTYKIPKDPWGQEYVYRSAIQETNAKREYDLFSLGVPGKNSPIGK
jgi:general secretion pathway protein G